MRVRAGTVTITGSYPHRRWSFCAQGHRMLSQYQASYPAILDMATSVSLTKLLCRSLQLISLHAWRRTQEACYDEDRARLPCNIRPLSRLAALSLPQGDDTRQLEQGRQTPRALGWHQRRTDDFVASIRFDPLQLCHGPDGRYHPSVAGGLQHHPR
jgi:hypothetical protein